MDLIRKGKDFIKSLDWFTYTNKTTMLYEIIRWFIERRMFMKEARVKFQASDVKGSMRDYKKAFWRHRISFSEYEYSYEYWKKNEKERDEFVSRSEMQCIYRKLGDDEVRKIFYDKVRFLGCFHQFVNRKWMLVKDSTFEEFRSLIEENDCIAKPISGTCGSGIFKIKSTQVSDWQSLYDTCVKNDILLEECLQAHDEIEAFHPNSLNTIRVVTISNNDKCVVFGALLRMGAHGSVIDNTHAGGVFAPINVETGVIECPAIDSNNNKYTNHPDTQKKIVDFKVPCWDEVKNTCIKATQAIPNIHFAGWDVCVLKDGRVEIIEGNHAPDFDGGMQAPLKIGVKKKVQSTVNKLMGVDPLDYISVWKKHLN